MSTGRVAEMLDPHTATPHTVDQLLNRYTRCRIHSARQMYYLQSLANNCSTLYAINSVIFCSTIDGLYQHMCGAKFFFNTANNEKYT